MTDVTRNASGLILAPMELVNALVCEYISAGHDLEAMRCMLAFALSGLAGKTLVAELSQSEIVMIDDCSLTVDQARLRIKGLQQLLVL
ncbi:hypothetical protein [Acidovorax sp.]|uniref:hypothetical protein n=1 Tax=Acidovorax sp. TaxID=1872122 RepID=UPI0025C4C64F|nr:hypothetical protein [Acidovorax sp.]